MGKKIKAYKFFLDDVLLAVEKRLCNEKEISKEKKEQKKKEQKRKNKFYSIDISVD